MSVIVFNPSGGVFSGVKRIAEKCDGDDSGNVQGRGAIWETDGGLFCGVLQDGGFYE